MYISITYEESLEIYQRLRRRRLPIRVAVLPYEKRRDGTIQFIMGIAPYSKRRTIVLSDFGGGARNNEGMMQALKRELCEEGGYQFCRTIVSCIKSETTVLHYVSNKINCFTFYIDVSSQRLYHRENDEIISITRISKDRALALHHDSVHRPLWPVLSGMRQLEAMEM